jgi:hypothetical protein
VVLAVEAYLSGKISFADVRAVREAAASGVAGAGMCGIPQAIPSAAAQISAWHTADDSPQMAAERVIHHAAAAAGFQALHQVSNRNPVHGSVSQSSWRDYEVWPQEPQTELAARSIERAILHGELQRRLREADLGGGHQGIGSR